MLWDAKNGKISIGGTEMHYVCFGRGEKTLAVLPGLSDGLSTVKGKALLLAWPYRSWFDRYTVFLFSRKERMPEGYSIRDMAEDQAEAFRILGFESMSVLGVSEGGMIAQCLAAGHPALVRKLIVAFSASRVNSQIAENVACWISLAEHEEHRKLMIDTAEKSYSAGYLKKFRKLYPIIGAVGKPSDYGRFLINANAILSFDAIHDLEKIVCPALIIGGSEDRIVGARASEETAAGIANSELFIYEGLGHGGYEEADDFYERVFSFLDKS